MLQDIFLLLFYACKIISYMGIYIILGEVYGDDI